MGKLGEAAKKIAPSGDMYIKFEDGTDITVRLLSDPWIRSKRYEDVRKLDENGQPTITLKTTFMWPVWDYAMQKVRLLEQGPSVANQIDAIDDKWNNKGMMPPSFDLTISATGNGLQRRYSVVPTPHQGTMPPSNTIEMPDMNKMAGEGAIALNDFLKGVDPVVQAGPSKQTEKQADVIVNDDEVETLNLDDIPF